MADKTAEDRQKFPLAETPKMDALSGWFWHPETRENKTAQETPKRHKNDYSGHRQEKK